MMGTVFLLKFSVFPVRRRGAPGRPRTPHSLPGRCVALRHHRHRLPDETHLDDHDRCLQVRQVPAAHHLAQPQLHGTAFRVRGRPEQRHHSTHTHSQTHRPRDRRIAAPFQTEYPWFMDETRMRKTERPVGVQPNTVLRSYDGSWPLVLAKAPRGGWISLVSMYLLYFYTPEVASLCNNVCVESSRCAWCVYNESETFDPPG